MREHTTRDIKDELMEKAFDFFAKNGLENTSLRDLCKGIGVSSGSMYYWFDNKEDIIISTAKYALSHSVDDVFKVAFDGMTDFADFVDRVFKAVEAYIPKMKFIYQVATSPKYGECLRQRANELYAGYEVYAKMLADMIGTGVDTMRPVVYMFMSILLHYIIWNDLDVAKMQAEALYKYLFTQIELERK